MKNDACVVAANEDKHVALDDAIESMDNVIQQANGILHHIQGTGSEGTGICDSTPRSLQEVLNFGSERIREKNSELHRILDEIKTSLF